jgi:dTDP-4-amino-4,6-dideoxygalactose transaminase
VAFPLDRSDCRLFSRARHGLFQALPAVGLASGDEVLVPAYHHGSEVEALIRAGVQPVFYGSDERLEPRADELEALVTPRTRALYLIHVLGFPQDTGRWRAWTADRELLLVEDAAQAWLATAPDGRPVGATGDLAVFCIYKTVGVPDGAAVVACRPFPGPAGPRRTEAVATAKRLAARVAQQRPAAGRLLAKGGQRPYLPERDFDLGDPELRPSRATRALLPRLSGPEPAARRRANYAALLERLGDVVAPAFAQLPAGASPFAFPIRVVEKQRVLERLAERGVLGLNLWSVPHPSVPVGRFPLEAAWRAGTIGLPEHQELGEGDVQRIADLTLDALGVGP